MRQPNAALKPLAQLLLTHEAEAERPSDALERVCATLRLHLAKLMGLDGFTLLIVRALTFARADFPWLAGIQTESDGSLKGVHAAAQQAPADALAGFTAVLSHFFGLLMALIGETLTLRLLQGIWPEIDLGGNDLDLGREETT